LALPALLATASTAGAGPDEPTPVGATPALAESASPSPTASAQPDVLAGAETTQLLALINAHRATHSLRPVMLDDALTAIAQPHTAAMVKANRLFHNDALFTRETHRRLGIKIFGENVGYGASVADNHDGFLASKLHHDNIDNPAFVLIGLGVARSSDRRVWVTEDFGSARTAPVTTPSPTRAAPPSPRPRPASATPAASASAPRRPRAVATTTPARRPSTVRAAPGPVVASPAARTAPVLTLDREPRLLAAPRSPAGASLVIPGKGRQVRTRAASAGLAATLATAAGLAVASQLPVARRRRRAVR